MLCLQPIGPFAPVHLSDQAVYNRLERAAGLMEQLFVQVSGWMRQRLGGLQDRTLAPFASQVLALDESTLDAVGRWLPELLLPPYGMTTYGMTTKKRDTSVLGCPRSHPSADWQQELKGKQREHHGRFTPFSWGNVFALFSHDMIIL